MRVLLNINNEDKIFKISEIKFNTFISTTTIAIYCTDEKLFFITVPCEDAEGIKISLLRDGYYDFREYKVS